MREVEYRAWDVDRRTMFCPQRADDSPMILMGALVSPSQYIPLQYTGRKDTNGAKVFDGHVLNVFPEGEPLYVSIEWDDEWAAWCCRASVNAKHLLRDIREPHVIAGNIYENPELLKGE